MPRIIVSLLTPIAVVIGLFAFASSSEAGGGGHGGCGRAPRAGSELTVSIWNNCFTAAVLYVEPNATVAWTNSDEVQHNVTFFDGSRAGGESYLERDESVSATFAEPGLYPYYCSLHPAMLGAVAIGDSLSLGVIAPEPRQPQIEPPTQAAPVEAVSGSRLSPAFAGLIVVTGLVSAGGGYLLRGRKP